MVSSSSVIPRHRQPGESTTLPPSHHVATIYRTVETPRAAVKKLRFAPGKGNTKLMVLYNSRLDIRDASSVSGCIYIYTVAVQYPPTPQDTVLSQQKWGPKDASVEDADWATSDKVVLLTSEGCVRVCEVSLKHSQSPVNTAELEGTTCMRSIPRLPLLCYSMVRGLFQLP